MKIENKEELHRIIESKQPNICQVAIIKNGKIVYKDTWNGYQEKDSVHVMSVTKSIISLLIGIALDQGKIKSIDDKVIHFFPTYQVKRGEKTIYEVTIRHLLAMKAPYKCKGDPWSKVCSSDDWTKTSLDFLGGRKGITNDFTYQTVCLHILSGILFQATKMKTVDYANEFLFKPLEIPLHKNFFAKTILEHKNFTINREPKENIWFSDPNGIGTPGYGLCLSALDLAKIGQLCLNDGVYQGQEIVSRNWISFLSTPTSFLNGKFQNMSYGSLWWIMDEKKKIYAAIGNSGNVIYIDEENQLAIGITSYFKPTVMDRIDFIEQVIKPLI